MFIKSKEFEKGNYKQALIDTFLKLDSEVKEKNYAEETGSTSNVVYVNQENIYCANCGDSRSVLFTNGKAYPLSEDHKPDNATELKRIERANHIVEDSRVDGNLALSRAFGDF